MLGRPAILPPTGTAAPSLASLRPGGVADALPVAAIRPVRPVDGVSSALEELTRAGIDVRTILKGGADALVARTLPTATALAQLLERARSGIVRGAPDEALAALDEGWDGAERTEGGWYYRGSALTLLGLPGEADRVLQQGLLRRGGSVALNFLASVVRAAQGDSAGARDALTQAQARRPADNVLVAWQAVLQARQGDVVGARRLLDPLLAAEPGSSVLSWAKQAISQASTDSARASLAAQQRGTASPQAAEAAERTHWSLPESESVSPLLGALRRLGSRFASAPVPEAASEVRMLLQSLAVGGALDRAARPEQSIATRSMLAAMLAVLARESSEPNFGRAPGTPTARGASPAPSRPLEGQKDDAGRWRLTPAVSSTVLSDESGNRTVASARSAVLMAVRAGSFDSALAWLPRVTSVEGEAAAVVLRHLLEGARPESSPESSPGSSPESAPRDVPSARRPTRVDDALAVPIRIGLSLLQQASARDEARAAVGTARAEPEGVPDRWSSGAMETIANGYAAPVPRDVGSFAHATSGLVAASAFAAPTAPASDADRSDAEAAATNATDPRVGLSLRVLALLCMTLAFTALVLGHGVLAIAFAGGASWLALRSSTVAAVARRQELAARGHGGGATPVADASPPVTSSESLR